MALSKIDTTNMIEDVPQSKLDNNINFRNIIINGDMSIAQRGTSETGKTSSFYLVDRMYNYINGLGTWTVSQETDAPSGTGLVKSQKFNCTTADASPAVSDEMVFQQRIEGQNLQYLKKGTSSAESLTLSFWVKSNKTGTYVCELYDHDNTRQISKSYTIDSANTWEKKTITFSGDTTGTFGNDANNSLQVGWWLGAGTNFTSGTLSTDWSSVTSANRAVGQVNLADSTSNEWYITGVQLEAGQVASDFEFLPFDVNLRRCLRYYWRIVGDSSTSTTLGMGFATSTTNQGSQIEYPVPMRSVPSIPGSSGIQLSDRNSYTLNYSSLVINAASVYGMTLDARVSSGLTVLRPGNNTLAPGTSNFIEFSAEL